MRQTILGVFIGLIFAGVGVFWWTARAQVEENAPPPPEVEELVLAPDELPLTDPGDMQGPTPPEASELSREEKRFFRYDRNRDRKITRNEMLSSRSDGFRKLDADGNNLLTFEEWAVTTAERFDSMDADGNSELSQSEFATSKPKPRAKRPRCNC